MDNKRTIVIGKGGESYVNIFQKLVIAAGENPNGAAVRLGKEIIQVDHGDSSTAEELLERFQKQPGRERNFSDVLEEKERVAFREAQMEWAPEVLKRFEALDMNDTEAVLSWLPELENVLGAVSDEQMHGVILKKFSEGGYSALKDTSNLTFNNDAPSHEMSKQIVETYLSKLEGNGKAEGYIGRWLDTLIDAWKDKYGERAPFIEAEKLNREGGGRDHR